ncbi:hypothetical protein [Sphingobium sp. B2]|uniref:hypothetical protein n=1 Tax=Sphingobium sp. B2 TaxID=2583228 RepID=UPI0011A479DF|nr:hypothetical protein [Sphingobium sp. B2]
MKMMKIASVAFVSFILSAYNTAYAYNNLEECLNEAGEQYYEQINRCLTGHFGVWGDPAERDYCQYSAGLEHDANRQSCYASYPDQISNFLLIDKRKEISLAYI